MMAPIPKTHFKARAPAILRHIEQSGQSVIITDRGKPSLEVKKLRQPSADPLALLKGTVLQYQAPTSPVADDDWENG